jgi:hypothetical protein
MMASPAGWDDVFDELDAVCRGTMQFVEAQRAIATDRLAVYRQNGLHP